MKCRVILLFTLLFGFSFYSWSYTCRGIPEMYYGTEVIMKGEKNPLDGWVRLDFPGGWQGDKKNAFTQEGLNTAEKEVQDYTRKLANYRKQSSALKTGKLMQYVPADGLYVYFRYDDQHTVMCVMNTSDMEKEVDFANYEERTKKFSKALNIESGASYESKFTITAKRMWVLELSK